MMLRSSYNLFATLLLQLFLLHDGRNQVQSKVVLRGPLTTAERQGDPAVRAVRQTDEKLLQQLGVSPVQHLLPQHLRGLAPMGVARNVKREHFTPKDLQDLLLSAADRENPRHHAGVRGVFNGNHGAGPMAYDLGLRGGPEQSKDGSDRIVQLEKNGNDAFKQQEFRGSLFDLLSPRPQQSHHLFLQTAPKPGSQAGRSSALFDLSRPEAVGNNDHKDGLRTFLGPVRDPLLPEFSDIDLMTSEEQDQELEMLMQGLLGGHEGGLDIMPPGLFDQPVTSQRNRPHQAADLDHLLVPFEGGAAASGLAAAAGGSGGRGSNSVPARRSPLASGGAKAGSIDRQRKLSTEKMIEDEAMDLLLEGMGLEAKLKGFLEAAHGKGPAVNSGH